MQFGFSYVGLIMLLMLFIPNFIWTKNQPKDYDKYAKNENKVLLALERIGQFIVTPAALIFSNFNFHGLNFWTSVLILALLNLVVYDIAWIRYFKSEKTMQDFYKSFLGMPLALATAMETMRRWLSKATPLTILPFTERRPHHVDRKVPSVLIWIFKLMSLSFRRSACLQCATTANSILHIWQNRKPKVGVKMGGKRLLPDETCRIY